jgi:hypothetical protein
METNFDSPEKNSTINLSQMSIWLLKSSLEVMTKWLITTEIKFHSNNFNSSTKSFIFKEEIRKNTNNQISPFPKN